jgi:hypothetical protein
MTDDPAGLAEKNGRPAAGGVWDRFGRRVAATFLRNLGGFIALNAVLTAANFATGRPWWAVWPLIVSGLALALHFFVYRAATADEQWVAERVEELNLKSYDRSHIEDIKERSSKLGYGKPRE